MAKHQTSKLIHTLFIVVLGCCFWRQPALANESGLALPRQPDAPVVLDIIDNIDSVDTAELLKVYVGNNSNFDEDAITMAGKYKVSHSFISFTPMFEFNFGQAYTVKYKLSPNESHYLTKTFTLQSDVVATPAHVTDIYPSGSTLPENILRFYIHFSEPMQPHMAKKFIQLVDENGHADNAAFMNFKQELWSPDRKRLTLLMDPGRIKRLVATNRTLGPALIAGKKYSLEVKPGWPTAGTQKNLVGYNKRFGVSKPLRSIPATTRWKIEKPTYNTKQPLTIKFDRPFDYQLLQSSLTISTQAGLVIKGRVIVDKTGEHWQFYPSSPWVSKNISLHISANLEDVAGNNFKDLLDHNIKTPTNTVNTIQLPIRL